MKRSNSMLERAAQSAKKDKKNHRSSSSDSGSDDSDVILERKLKKTAQKGFEKGTRSGNWWRSRSQKEDCCAESHKCGEIERTKHDLNWVSGISLPIQCSKSVLNHLSPSFDCIWFFCLCRLHKCQCCPWIACRPLPRPTRSTDWGTTRLWLPSTQCLSHGLLPNMECTMRTLTMSKLPHTCLRIS